MTVLTIQTTERSERQDAKGAIRKQANITGFDSNVKIVGESRQVRNIQPYPPDYENMSIRVQYLVNENDGFVHIQSIAILCESGWDTFFDREQGRIDNVTIGKNQYHFLREGSLDAFLTLISDYEMSDRKEREPIMRRLRSAGPEAFPKTHHLSE